MSENKIVLINSDGEYKLMESNKGAEAVIICTVQILKYYFPKSEIITTFQISERLQSMLKCKVLKNKVFSYKTYSFMTSLKSSFNLIRCVAWYVCKRYLKLDIKFLRNNKKLNAYFEADYIIHVGMDLYSDDFGTRTIIEHSKDILQAILMGRKVVIWAESLGPFENKISRFLAKLTLDNVDLITVRENLSIEHLNKLGIRKVPTHVTMDPAFLLEKIQENEIDVLLGKYKLIRNSKPIFGMCFSLTYLAGGVNKSFSIAAIKSMSKFLQYILPENIFNHILTKGKKMNTYSSSREKFTKEMTLVVDYVVETYDAEVLLIPHIQHPVIGEQYIHEMILQHSNHKDKIRLISGELSAQEIKGIISMCDFFVGGRMHADIAALSQCIPTVGLSYSYKFYGIMSLLKQQEYVCTEITSDNVIKKINDVYSSKDKIKAKLIKDNEDTKKLAYLNGKLLKDLKN